jgi:hypothetical protein
MKEIIDKLDFILIKNFSLQKTMSRNDKTFQSSEKTFVKDISNKELLSKIDKELLKFNSKTASHTI